MKNGFGLIGILIVIAVIALAGGGGFYWKEAQNQKNAIQMGADAIKRAEELKKQIESREEQIYRSPTSIDLSKDSLNETQNYTAYNSEESFGGINTGDSIFLNWYIVPDGASKIRLYRSLSSQGPWIRVRDYPVDMLKYGPVDGVDGTKTDIYYKAEAISPSEAVLKEYGVLRIPKYIDEYGDLKSSKIDTSTRKTYRNEKYGFEVKYPENWKFEIIPDYDEKGEIVPDAQVFFFTSDDLHRVIIAPHGSNVPRHNDSLYGWKEIFSNQKYARFTISILPINARQVIDQEKIPLLKTIVSTFKFTN